MEEAEGEEEEEEHEVEEEESGVVVGRFPAGTAPSRAVSTLDRECCCVVEATEAESWEAEG